jgi:N-acetyl-1-D-myo-inositol-2-amino-2-deoxy-alpha-D-glucopyranoside deacetylase
MIERPRLLVVDPHPDDESLFMGGTLAKYTSIAEIHLLVLSNGEKGRMAVTSLEKGVIGFRSAEESEETWLAETRKQECLAVAEVLNINPEHVEFAGIPDGSINMSVIPVIKESIERVDPHIVVSLSEAGTTRPSNSDHSWSGIATFAAIMSIIEDTYGKLTQQTFKLPSPPPFSLRRFLTYSLTCADKLLDEWAELILSPDQLTQVDVSWQVNTKLQACRAHTTQGHIVTFFEKAGIINLASEVFYERINLGPSAKGESDILFGINESINYLNISSFPENPSCYSSSDPNFSTTLEKRCLMVSS